MPIASPRYPFTKVDIGGAPADPGVYAIYQGEELIYLGCAIGAETIRSCLAQHMAGARAPAAASHYAWEICRDPRGRQAELIREFRAAFKRDPRHNALPT